MGRRPLCFVLMPFGTKPDAGGRMVDFDDVYRSLIRPAVEAADLEPLRADEEVTGGLIHKPMFERLVICEYAVADLTTANANVFYELGVRHALRPASTVSLFAEGARLPFDLAPLRVLPYRLTSAGRPDQVEETRAALTRLLEEARDAKVDSPVFQLVEGLPPARLEREKTDVFRDQVEYTADVKRQLARARDDGVDAVRAVRSTLGPVEDADAAVVIDLLLSFRAVESWDDMIELVDGMSPPVAATVLVQEQRALALNRAGRGEEAEEVLKELIARRGPSSETCGLLGRVYKDRWERALEAGNAPLARGALRRAIDAYLQGFEADWRDAYPGVNAVMLLELFDPEDPRRECLLPVVAYAAARRLAREPDYWDFATALELAVLADDQDQAHDALEQALEAVREQWEPKTTARNLKILREAREQRGRDAAWIGELESALAGRAAEVAG